jgi:hypothetical protein
MSQGIDHDYASWDGQSMIIVPKKTGQY